MQLGGGLALKITLKPESDTAEQQGDATRNSFRGRERLPKPKSLPLKLILVLSLAAVEPRLWRLNAPGRGITPLVPSILARTNDPRSMIKGHMPKRPKGLSD